MFALAKSYRLAVRRQAPITLVRALLVTASGAAATGLAARNNLLVAPDAIAALSLGTLSFIAVVATGGIDRAVADAERATGWLLDAAGMRRAVRLAAACGAVAVYAAGCGLLHGGAVAAILGGGPAAVAGLATLCAVWAAALAAGAARLRRRRG